MMHALAVATSNPGYGPPPGTKVLPWQLYRAAPGTREMGMQSLVIRRQYGQGVVEYGLFLSLVSLAAVGSLAYFGEVVSTLVSTIAASV